MAFLVTTLVMSVYEVAIDTIMMCFLEDEAENIGDKPSFATGQLAKFMKSTKTISDAAEDYNDSIRGAKTKKIEKERECTTELTEHNESIKAAVEGGKASDRSAKKRRKQKKDEHAEKNADKEGNPLAS